MEQPGRTVDRLRHGLDNACGDDFRRRNAPDRQRLDYARRHDATGGDRPRRQFLVCLYHPALAVSGSPYTITYAYPGDANHFPITDTSQTLAVSLATPAWSNLSGPSIAYGTASTMLSGTILDGTMPPTGSVSITLNGTTQQAAIGAGGSFSSSFDTQALAVSGSPYTITYAYAGDANSNAAVPNSSQELTVAKAAPAWSNLSGPSIAYTHGLNNAFRDDPRRHDAPDGQSLDYARRHDAAGGDRRRRQFLVCLRHAGPGGLRFAVHDYLRLRGRRQFEYGRAQCRPDAGSHEGHARLEQSVPGRRSPTARLRRRFRGRSSTARHPDGQCLDHAQRHDAAGGDRRRRQFFVLL